jgi:hypothetical protein
VNIVRVKALLPWLAEARYVWLALAVSIAALVIALRPGTTEPVIRLTGLVLQILGIGTVAWGISETRTLYGHKPLFAVARGWIERFPLRKRNFVLGAAGIASATAFSRARGHVTHGTPPNPTVEERLDALEKNIGALHKRIGATQKELDEELAKLKTSVSEETRQREQEDQGNRKLIEMTATGGVHISAIGAVWLFVGVILSTAGVEIAAALAK